MATTLNQLVMQIAWRFGHALAGTATSGSSTTLADTANLIQSDDYWTGATIYFLTGANAGQSRIISSYTSNALIWTLALSNPVSAADTYQLLPRPRQNFVDAIQEAIRKAGESWMVMKDDSTSLLYGVDQEYTLPADLFALSRVYIGDGQYWAPITTYQVVPNSAGAYKLLLGDIPFTRYVDYQAPYTSQMRLEYLAMPALLSNGSDTLGLAANMEREAISFITEYAFYILHERELALDLTGTARQTHISLSRQHLNEAMRILMSRKPSPQRRHIRTRAIARQVQ